MVQYPQIWCFITMFLPYDYHFKCVMISHFQTHPYITSLAIHIPYYTHPFLVGTRPISVILGMIKHRSIIVFGIINFQSNPWHNNIYIYIYTQYIISHGFVWEFVSRIHWFIIFPIFFAVLDNKSIQIHYSLGQINDFWWNPTQSPSLFLPSH